MPLMLQKLKDKLAEQPKRVTITEAQSILDDIKVSVEIRTERLRLCQSCEHHYEKINICAMCGCLTTIKTWIPISSCPVNKWDRV